MPERELLSLLLTKEAYHLYYEYIDLPYLKENYRELHYVYLALKEAHESTDANLSVADLQAWFFQRYPDADKEIYLGLFKTLSEASIDPALGLTLLSRMKARKQALKLSEAAFKYSNGNGEIDAVVQAFDGLSGTDTESKEEFEFVTTDLSAIVADVFHKSGLRWRLDALNKSLGSLRKGNFGFLFARPETGKTTFLASEITHMLAGLEDGDGPVIWFNNEQVGAEVMLRVYQGYFGITKEAILANHAKYKEAFQHQTQGRFLLVDNADFDKAFVERVLKRFNPSLVVFDQIDKVKGFNDDREDLRLGAIYIWARELAKKYCPVIGVCQADGTGDGQKWLTMNNVANAKTSKQAEADWILGIGTTHAEGMQLIRYLNISKNKLMGDDDSLPKLRHGRFEVMIEPEIARFKDIIKYE